MHAPERQYLVDISGLMSEETVLCVDATGARLAHENNPSEPQKRR